MKLKTVLPNVRIYSPFIFLFGSPGQDFFFSGTCSGLFDVVVFIHDCRQNGEDGKEDEEQTFDSKFLLSRVYLMGHQFYFKTPECFKF